MKILTTPWKHELLELVSMSRDSIKITSPFAKESICSEIFKAKQQRTKFELITSFKLMSVHTGSLDLSALKLIIANAGVVKNFSKLHSKIYLFDEEKAVITSSNLTIGGLLNNYEYGVLVTDKSTVSEICNDFDALSNNENTGVIKESDLNAVENILSNIAKVETVKLPSYRVGTPEQNLDVIETPNAAIANTLTGWRLDVFSCLNNVIEQEFTLADVYRFEDDLSAKYSNNNNVRDQIRKQLQNLRDLGLVEFMGAGRYRKLWRQNE